MKNEIILYRPNEAAEHIEVRVENETVWLNRNQIALLFGRDVKTIGKHINNALNEELNGIPTVAKFATVHFECKRKVSRYIEYYNLDVILSHLLNNQKFTDSQKIIFRKNHFWDVFQLY